MVGFFIVPRDSRARSAPVQGRSASVAGVLDILVDGANVTARVGEGQTGPFLRDLAHSTVTLASGRSLRESVRFYLRDEPWELGLARDGQALLLTVFRGGQQVEVATFERRVDGGAWTAGIHGALRELIQSSGSATHELEHASALLEPFLSESRWSDVPALEPRHERLVLPQENASLSHTLTLTARLHARAWPLPRRTSRPPERSDLFSLLVPGEVHLHACGRSLSLGEVYPFVLAEQLVRLLGAQLDAVERQQSLAQSLTLGALAVSTQGDAQGTLSLTISGKSGRVELRLQTSLEDLAEATASFVRGLSRAILRCDREQGTNLRFRALRDALRSNTQRLRKREAAPSSCVNAAPESYKAFAVASQESQGTPAHDRFGHARIRFSQRWSGTVPGIDLRGTFLCGDRLLVTGSRETACIDRATGDVLWKRSTARAVTVPTPGGLARMLQDGQVNILDFGTGETTCALKLQPSRLTPPTGAVVHAPGLPRLLVVTEGDRSLSAIDVVSGELRWRVPLVRKGPCRLRRTGRLLIATAGSPALEALDVQTGEVVWRHVDEAPFIHPAAVDQDDVVVVSGCPLTRGSLSVLDAWSGQPRLRVPLPQGVVPWQAPLVTHESIVLVHERNDMLGVLVFDRRGGALRGSLEPGFAPLGSSWMVLDDALIVNTEHGQLLSYDLTEQRERFRLQLRDPLLGDDCPRRLDPVLRSGALFVPQHELFVVRPKDGEVIGHLKPDLIPDLVRIDERCDVYLAEESGHVSAFSAGAKLTRVK